MSLICLCISIRINDPKSSQTVSTNICKLELYVFKIKETLSTNINNLQAHVHYAITNFLVEFLTFDMISTARDKMRERSKCYWNKESDRNLLHSRPTTTHSLRPPSVREAQILPLKLQTHQIPNPNGCIEMTASKKL